MLKLFLLLFAGTLAVSVPTSKLAARDCVISDQCSLFIGHCAQDIAAPGKDFGDLTSIPSCIKAAQCIGSVAVLSDDICCLAGEPDFC